MSRDPHSIADQQDGAEDDGDNPLRAPALRMPPAKRKRRSHKKSKGRSGPTIPEATRKERGQVLLAVRVDAALLARLDAECERRGLLRPALVRTALEEWLATAP